MHKCASYYRFNILYPKETFSAMSRMVPAHVPTPSLSFGGAVNYNKNL